MTKFDQIKILDNKIKANKAQYMLEDLGYKPDALTQAKFEYSPFGKTLTFGLTKEDKKE